MRKRSRSIEGVVVGKKDFQESDSIILLFAPKAGKLRLIAKGLRKINSRRSGNLELGNKVKILIAQGKTFDIVTEVETIDNLSDIKNNSAKLGGLLFLSELINRLLPEGEKNERVYQHFIQTRQALREGKIQEIVKFEAKILDLLGFGKVEKEQELLKKGNWKEAHRKLRKRIENITERKMKTLAIFN